MCVHVYVRVYLCARICTSMALGTDTIKKFSLQPRGFKFAPAGCQCGQMFFTLKLGVSDL